MKYHLAIVLTCLLPLGVMAQRGGGGHGGGGGGGMHSGGGFSGGHVGGGFSGGVGTSFNRGGFGGGGFNRGFGFGGFRGYGYGGWGYGVGFGYPWYGYGYWPGYYGYGYAPDYYDYGYPASYASAYQYNPSPNVTVVYGQQQPAYQIYSPPSQAATGGNGGGYDQYGQQYGQPPQRGSVPTPPPSGWANANAAPAGSPIYLIAFKDHSIHAAMAYSVNGTTLHYVTMEHEEKTAPLDSVDRALSTQLNRERRVPFALPGQ